LRSVRPRRARAADGASLGAPGRALLVPPVRARRLSLPRRPRRPRSRPPGAHRRRRGSRHGARGERGSMGAVVLGRLTAVPRSRLIGWAILVGALALISYAANLAGGGNPPDDVLYRWSTVAGGIIQ